jgi:hypothetical protein
MMRSMTSLTALLVAAQLAFAALTAEPAGPRGPSIDAYRGPGAWVDVYSRRELARPEATVAALARHGVRTLYLETANHRRRPSQLIVWPRATERFLDAAHARGILVVAWYLPGFDDLDADYARAMAAIDFETAAGERFDGFALDIEATKVRSIPRRNAAMLALSRDLRAAVGRDRALGAIVPDALSTTCRGCLWPGFPYRSVARLYDVFLPMTYSTLRRGRGAAFTDAYTRANIAHVRRRTARPGLPVHVIGGLADRLSAAESRAVVDAARARGATGASFYNLRLSGPEEWSALRRSRLAPGA